MKGKKFDLFLCISKAFDRVRHKGLLYTIEILGIRGNFLLWVKCLLSGRKQRLLAEKSQPHYN